MSIAKFSDFAKLTNDFFGKEFPAGQVRVEVKSTAKPSAGAKTSFTDVKHILSSDYILYILQEFKLITVRDAASGAISAEVKNTTCVPLGIGKMRKNTRDFVSLFISV